MIVLPKEMPSEVYTVAPRMTEACDIGGYVWIRDLTFVRLVHGNHWVITYYFVGVGLGPQVRFRV